MPLRRNPDSHSTLFNKNPRTLKILLEHAVTGRQTAPSFNRADVLGKRTPHLSSISYPGVARTPIRVCESPERHAPVPAAGRVGG